VEVTLDPDSAHPQLYISNQKSVTCRDAPQSVDFSEKRFARKCVVAFQEFHTGKHYWEVDVGCNEQWILGVCQDDVNRKDKKLTLSPKNGYWVLRLKSSIYSTSPNDKTSLFISMPPTRVGVFLDCQNGFISFFNINDRSQICTQKLKFKGLLRPYIHLQKETVNPIFISP
jgi:hypothetical protein